ncbi:MAG TPA: GAP family protein [Amaricoccus sp.]|uniref:GAP family protein n=1 Tax=Amaricoccus sp. TaxID=1872485 RepID=UPI002BE65005|nr:GAP family protein [Amaricoccus sp.]HMQ92402.1 GAP family protein [Amaricoccus sp.]HMR53149.1 GAP family protein [Amaricoccus sp.]HMR59414.1 GAP family protein [Amaricoccus sp.]HMT99996.1 GAP family protein [Amaricoccus sp.]
MTGGALDAAALVLPLAMGVALSPFPVVGAILVLSGPRATTAGPAFAAGFVAGLAALTTLVVALLDGAGLSAGPLANLIRLGAGLGLLAAAAAKWCGRPRGGAAAPVPGWMAALGDARPLRAFGIGAALGGVNPKNIAFAAGAAGSIAGFGLIGRDAAGPALAFVLLGSASVLAATAARLVAGKAATRGLDAARAFMIDNGPVILAVVFSILGVKLAGEGLTGLLQ